MHWHRLGERCHCGYIGVPAAFYWHGKVEISHEQAVREYLEWAREHKPELYEKLTANPPANINDSAVVSEPANTLQTANICPVCNERPCRPRGNNCWQCYRKVK